MEVENIQGLFRSIIEFNPKTCLSGAITWFFDSGPPPLMGIRAQGRFMPPRWRQPGPGLNFDGDSTVGPLPR